MVGWSIRSNEWVELPCAPEIPLVRVQAALQLADRSGAVNRVQLSTMRDLVHQFAAQVGVSCECPDIDAAAHAAACMHAESLKAAAVAGAVEAALCLLALREGWLPPNVPVANPDPVCLFQLIQAPADFPLRRVLSNSFVFGGANATLALQHFSDA
jgi:hypothetical protein